MGSKFEQKLSLVKTIRNLFVYSIFVINAFILLSCWKAWRASI